jgi:hypothetical protein
MAEGKGSAVIYMLRTTQQHHVQLSMMADQKASALLAACFVTLSISVAYASNHQPSLPLLVIMAFAVLSAFFAAFAVMPRIHLRRASGTPRNLLFFGDFADLSLEQYLTETKPLLSSDEAVYMAILEDIWCLGQVLMKRKYRFLALAYRCFILGLLAAPLAWALEYALR